MHREPTVAGAYRVALNPIQWFASADGYHDRSQGPGLEELLALVRRSGFRAVPAAVPAGTAAESYRAILDRAGLRPAPGYFAVPSPEQSVPLSETLEYARKAAGQQAALGQAHVFIALGMPPLDSVRLRRPAVGAGYDRARLERIADAIGRAAEAMKGEGVTAALHPHVGTWVESESEARHVLAAVAEGVLAFGPDTGHLAWAGADVASLFRDFRHRIPALHVKDVRLAVRDEALAGGRSYPETVLAGLWAEPGTGDLDLDGLIALLGETFEGWIIVEVDRPARPPFESAQLSARWASSLRKAAAA
ncbi:MAG TPA: sugar phosphate isomerase/epimerase [Microvirga sp.]|nr:sugar phosphate isomerase/epimerase [Microvirga sp.]